MISRREFVASVTATGAGVVAGCGTDEDATPEETPAPNDLGIELLDHTFRRTAGGGIEIELTLENRADEEWSVDITVQVYDDETLLDETLMRMTTPAGEQNTSSSVLVDLAAVEAVTHYVLSVRRDPFVEPEEAPLREAFDGDRLRETLE